MYSSDESDDEETVSSNSQSHLYHASLKPALDDIFAEVQAKIPVIGSDSESELNSDEEPVHILNRGLVSLTHPKDLPLTVKEAFEVLDNESDPVSQQTTQTETVKTSSSPSTDSGFSMPDLNDSCYTNKTSSEEDFNATASPTQVSPKSKNFKTHKTNSSSSREKEPSSSNALDNNIQLNFGQLADIDFASLMNQFNEVTVPPWQDINPLETSSNDNDDKDSDSTESSSTEDLMKQLVSLSQKQKGEAHITLSTSTSTTSHAFEEDTLSSELRTVDSGIQADEFFTEEGTMTMQCTTSIGVSASFGVSSQDFVDQNKQNSEERGTIFLDLRNQKIEPKKSGKISNSVSSSIQRILGIQDIESSSSGSEDENDMELWHEQRRRIKQAIAERNQTSAKITTITSQKKSSDKRENKQVLKIPSKEACTRQDNAKKVEPVTVPKSISSEDSQRKIESVEEEKKISLEEKRSKDKEVQKAPNKKTDEKLHINTEKNYILINRHISPTETVAEFVLMPSPEFDRITSELKAVKDQSTTPAEITKRNVKEAWGELPVDEPKANKLLSKPEERDAIQPLAKVEKELVETRVTDASTNTLQPLDVNQSLEDKKAKAKPSKKDLEQQKILNEKIKAKRNRIQQRLESVKKERESRNVVGRICIAAPETPVIYDIDASYEATPLSLPNGYSNKQYLLLSISLSSCGELLLGGNKVSSGKSNNRNNQLGIDFRAYSMLLAWVLSLVPIPENSYYMDFAAVCDSPFYVIGLQQTWHEGELSVKIGICSRDEFQPSRSKQGGRANAFQSSVSKFLKTNTLISLMSRLTNYSYQDFTIGHKNLSSLLNINSDPQAMIRVFGREPGFFWKTLEVEDTVDKYTSNMEYCGPDVNNTMMLVGFEAFHDPSCMYDILNRVRIEGLDLAGIRLLYTHNIPLEDRPGLDQSTWNIFPQDEPILALAIRGPDALLRWLEVVGPNDVWLARRTNPNSLRVMYSNDREDHLFYCPRHSARANTELARWFGGRVPPGDSLNIGNEDVVFQRPRSGSRGRKEEELPTSGLQTPLPSPPCTLVASTESLVVVVASPIITPRCFGLILAICFSRGFALHGVRRIRFNPPQFKDIHRDALGLSTEQMSVFCPLKTYVGSLKNHSVFTHDVDETEHPYPFSVASTMFCLRKENGAHNAASLVRYLTEELAQFDYLPNDVIARGQTAVKTCFAIAPYSDHFANVVGSKMKQIPNSNMYAAASLSHSFYSNPELEQVCILTLLKEKATRHCHTILDCLTLSSPRISHMLYEEDEQDYCGFELLGIKLLSSMTLHQAKEFTPYEIGDKLWQSSLKPLTSGPALIIALRGINSFERLRDFLHSYCGGSPRKRPQQTKEGSCPDMFMSSTPEIAYRQLTAIFFEHELYSDYSKRTNLHFLPNPVKEPAADATNLSPNPKQKGKKSGRGNTTQGQTSGVLLPDDVPIISSLLAGPNLLNTVCIIKPDAAPNHVGKVLKRLTREGFTIVNMRMDMLTEGDAMAIVARDCDSKKADKNTHVNHLTSGACMVMSIQRENAVGKLLDVLGPSSPDQCRHESQFFLRGSYGTDKIRNALYGSCTYIDAVKDHKLLFEQGVCCSPTPELEAEGIPCLASDKIFMVDSGRSLVDVPEGADIKTSQDQTLSTLLPPSLLEMNCVLLLPDLLGVPGSLSAVKQTPGFIEVIDGLISAGAQLVGVRMLRFNDSQAAHCARMYSDSLSSDKKPHQLAACISQGPCLVLAILRDGAFTSFESLLGDPMKTNSLAVKYRNSVLAAKSFKKARTLLECFFDRLMPNNKAQIQCSQ